MKPNEMTVNAEGIRDALNLGISEALYLGAEFLGLTLDNGMGLILRLSPEEEILNVMIMTRGELSLPLLGVFIRSDGEQYYIYNIDDIKKLNSVISENRKVMFVEVISGALEDFLREALQR